MTSKPSEVDAAPVEESVAVFFANYRRAFEARDIEALQNFFSYPILLTNGEAEQRLLPSYADYTAVVRPVLAAYRELGAEVGKVLDLQITQLAPSLAVAFVQWEIATKDSQPLYQHTAAYTLARKDAWRIAAIAVDELPKLREALRAQRQPHGQGR